MQTERLGHLSPSLPALVIVLGVSLLLSRPARTQIYTGCASYLYYGEFACQSGCSSYYDTYIPVGEGYEEFIGQPERVCCGEPYMIYEDGGPCQIAGPQSQTYSPTADELKGARAGRPPAKPRNFFARLAMPEYLMDCKGRYIFYLAPVSN